MEKPIRDLNFFRSLIAEMDCINPTESFKKKSLEMVTYYIDQLERNQKDVLICPHCTHNNFKERCGVYMCKFCNTKYGLEPLKSLPEYEPWEASTTYSIGHIFELNGMVCEVISKKEKKTEFKPCPFCGENPKINCGKLSSTIFCDNCKISVQCCSAKSVLKKWNKRAGDE